MKKMGTQMEYGLITAGVMILMIFMITSQAVANSPPVAQPQTLIADEDTPLEIDLIATDPDTGDVLKYEITSGPGEGTLSGTPPHVIYTPNLNYVGADKFTFRVTDLAGEISAAVVILMVRDANDPPVIQTTSGSPCYSENDPAIAIDNGIILSDPDDGNMTVAIVQITDGYDYGKDTVLFTDAANIHATWDQATGTLTLTGTATIADYQAALRSVMFQNTIDDFVEADRKFTITVKDENAINAPNGILSAHAERIIFVDAINDAPILNPANGSLQYLEGDGAKKIDSTITVADVDDEQLIGAKVEIINNYQLGQDILLFNNTANINGTWNAASGTLNLTGTSSIAEYQAALRSVSYENTSAEPSGADRTVRFSVTDSNSRGDGSGFCTSGGGALTAVAIRTITVTSVNMAPELLASDTDLCFVENTTSESAPKVDSAITITDVDDTLISGAVFRISDGYEAGKDMLTFANTTAIIGKWDNGTGTLTLTGTAIIAEYQTALRTVTFQNSGDSPKEGEKTVVITVTDASGNISDPAIRSIFVDAINDAPVLSPNISSMQYRQSDGAAIIDANILLSDVDDSQLTGAIIRIAQNYQYGEDLLHFTNTSHIQSYWDAWTGTLTLVGTTASTEYQTALRSVSYENTRSSPVTLSRTIIFSITDNNSSGTGSGFCSGASSGGKMQGMASRIINVFDILPPYFGEQVFHSSYEDVQSGFTVVIFADENISDPSGQYSLSISSEDPALTVAQVSELWMPYTIPAPPGYRAYQLSISYTPPADFNHDTTGPGVGRCRLSDKTTGFPADFQDHYIFVAGVNDAPILKITDFSLTPVSEDDTNPIGNTIAEIIANREAGIEDAITDVDGQNMPEAIAVIGADNTKGVWQYSLDGGLNWNYFGTLSETRATLLGASSRIRFKPAQNFSGKVEKGVTFRAWDQSDISKNSVGKIDVDVSKPQQNSPPADTSAYSTASGFISVNVIGVNDAPTAINACYSISGTEVTGVLTGSDPDNDGIVYAIVKTPLQGSVTLNSATGVFRYSPNPNFQCADVFMFKVSDGLRESSTVSVGIVAESSDADADGVPDQWDNCPQTPANSYVDSHGCPAPTKCDMNNDNKTGLVEAIRALQIVAGIVEN